MSKIKNSELFMLAEIYNSDGKQELYKLAESKYHMSNPSSLLRRMKKKDTLKYNSDKDIFEFDNSEIKSENVFMSMDELCSPMVTTHAVKNTDEEYEKPVAMEKLVQELLGDRLLELNKYIKLDSLSKRIIIDRTLLLNEGYSITTH